MKKIRLEVPLCWGTSPDVYMPSNVYLKVVGTRTEAFIDKEFTQPIPKTEKKISLELDVPKEIGVIWVVSPVGMSAAESIGLDWIFNTTDPNWKIPGLQKVLIIYDRKTHEIPVFNEKPDIEEFFSFIDINYLFFKPWALAIYITDTKTFGIFHWHNKLVNKL